MERGGKQRNNAGMSLVEVIVVVLIMGVLSAGAVIGFTFIRNMDASSAAETLVAALNRTKLQTTAAGEGETISLKIVQDGSHYYGLILKETGAPGSAAVTEIDKIEIGSTGVSIAADDDDAATAALTIDTSHPCVITYQKSNGAFTSAYTKLTVSGAKTKTVRMVTATGRCYME